jgi:hypothetical protein
MPLCFVCDTNAVPNGGDICTNCFDMPSCTPQDADIPTLSVSGEQLVRCGVCQRMANKKNGLCTACRTDNQEAREEMNNIFSATHN